MLCTYQLWLEILFWVRYRDVKSPPCKGPLASALETGQERWYPLCCEGYMGESVVEFLKEHIGKQDDPFKRWQASWFAENSRTIETLDMSQSDFFNYHSIFVVLTRTAGMECSLLLSPDVLTALIGTSSARTKQEENTNCMGYLLRAMTIFLVRERQLYFRRAQQGIILI